MFPVDRMGGLLSTDWVHTFHALDFYHFSPQYLFITEKQRSKKRNSLPSDWPSFWPPSGQETGVA